MATMIPNEDRSGSMFAVTFALTMLINTEHGDTYTLGEYRLWLEEAGFTGLETTEIGTDSPMLVARKG